jgi:sugar phosphate isomerase/epimerase
MKSITRRKFVQNGMIYGMALSGVHSLSTPSFNSILEKRKIYIFSKHLHWLNYNEMASFISECGFDGADITVRNDGHVEPGRVDEDLPRVVEALKKRGKETAMITTSILSAEEPNAERIIKTAASLGVRYYRLGWYEYDPNVSIEANMKTFSSHLLGLAALNEKYNIKATYQNHAGTSLGSPVWDIGQLLHQINSPWIGCQYDVRHATVEGGNSWTLGFRYIKPYINSLDVKDFKWTEENGKWVAQNVPLGEGMVDFDTYFKLVNILPTSIPMCLHMEYPLGGAEHGNKNITLPPEDVKKMMKRELEFLRRYL